MSRIGFVLACLVLAVNSVSGQVASAPASRPAWLSRANFDRLDGSLHGGNGFKTGTGSDIAWGESYIMLAYVDMYRATGDTHYLDKLVDHAGHVLAGRDDRRGFKDYSGRSRPAWSVGEQYTVAELTLREASGKDVLKFRSTQYAYNNQTRITISPRPAGGLDLTIENPQYPPREEHKNLSMDRGSPEFIERRLNACRNVALDRRIACGNSGSRLVTVEVIGRSPGLPARDNRGEVLSDKAVNLVPLVMAYHGYSGQATYPMLEFARLVKQDRRLAGRYGSAADRCVAAAVEVFMDAEENWRDGPGQGRGHYVFGPRGCPFWSDNVAEPHNYLASAGRSLVRLGQLTRDPRWRQHAEAIARLTKDHLRPAPSDAYVWNYWWGPVEVGWSRENSPSFNTPFWPGGQSIEDTSHGHLEIEFFALCCRAGCVFDRTDMSRLARTFLNHVVDRKRWTLANRVDGSDGWGKHDGVLGGWLELATWDRQVLDAGLKVAEARKLCEVPNATNMLVLARLMKHAGGGSRITPPAR